MSQEISQPRAVAKPSEYLYAVGMFGFLNIKKPVGPTSHDIVARVGRAVSPGLPRKQRVKIGHAGTLDPFAQGVLVICLGQATRLAEFVQAQPKRYTAQITLGAISSTDDTEGEISPQPPADSTRPDEQTVRAVLKNFVGRIQQIPPAYSAVHIKGKRAYQLARDGEEVIIPARDVDIYELNLLRYEYPLLEIDVRCGSGTYIRSLARDIGQALAVGGYCSKLIRTAVGQFDIDSAIPPEDLDGATELELTQKIIKPTDRIDLPIVRASEAEVVSICQGKKIPADLVSAVAADNAPPVIDAELIAVIDVDGRLTALVSPMKLDGLQLLKPKKVFPR